MAQGIDLASLMEQFRTVGAAEAAAKQTVDTQQAAADTATTGEIAATRREADLHGQLQTMVDQLLLDRQQQNQASAAEFGTNRNASSYVIGSLAQKEIQTSKELLQSAQDIADAQDVGFTDNPIQWLMNQFTLPTQVSQHNAKVAQLDIIQKTIAGLQAGTDEAVKNNNSIAASTSVDIMALNAERLKAAAEKEVERTRYEASKNGIHTASVRLAMDQASFANVISLNRAMIDYQQLQIAQAHLTLAQEVQKERLKELEEKHKSDEALQIDLNRATSVLGYRQLTPQQFRNMAGPLRAAIEQAMADPNIQEGRISSNPVTAVTLSEQYNFPLTPAKQEIKTQLANMMVTAQKDNPAWSALKPEQKQAAYLGAVNAEIGRQLKNIPDQGSMFSAPPLQAMGEIPEVAKTQLWQQYIAPLAKNKSMPTSAQQIFDIASRAVSEGKMSLAQASGDISTIYQAAVTDNWHNRDYGAFSIKVAPEYRSSYNTRIKLPTTFGSNQSVDMANATNVQNLILRSLNAQRVLREGAPTLRPPSEPEVLP